jgi:hypothetical protein
MGKSLDLLYNGLVYELMIIDTVMYPDKLNNNWQIIILKIVR